LLTDRPEVLARVKTQFETPTKDSTAVNPTRNAVGTAILAYGLSVWL
jgi:hypothetical protein